MKKQYEIPAVEVMETTTEALLQASLPLIDEGATGSGMSRETEDEVELPKFNFE